MGESLNPLYFTLNGEGWDFGMVFSQIEKILEAHVLVASLVNVKDHQLRTHLLDDEISPPDLVTGVYVRDWRHCLSLFSLTFSLEGCT